MRPALSVCGSGVLEVLRREVGKDEELSAIGNTDIVQPVSELLL